jgi:hypothetical protein
MRTYTTGIFILASLMVLWLAVPLVSAEDAGDMPPYGTVPELNITSGAIANQTLLAQYAITPPPLRIEVTVSETLLPAAKGEMAAGPRSIGFSFTPVTLVVLIIVVGVLAAGLWYAVRRTPVERDEE